MKFTKEVIQQFIGKYGQTDDELSAALGTDADDGFSELAIGLGYVWLPEYAVWIDKNTSWSKTSEDIFEQIYNH